MEQERRGAASRRRGHQSSPLRRHRRAEARTPESSRLSPVAATSPKETERPRENNGMLGLRVRLTRRRRRLIHLNGPAPCHGLRGPGLCLHHGPTWQPKHSTGTPAVVPGRAFPVLGRAGCRAAPRAGPFWTCINPNEMQIDQSKQYQF
jgi:hypothetical protein